MHGLPLVSAHPQLYLSDSNRFNVTIVSVYSPTHRAPWINLLDYLQAVIRSTPLDDLSLDMNDFNARVRCGDDMEPLIGRTCLVLDV